MKNANQVYVLDFNDRIKIGRTIDVPRRIRNIETQSGREVLRSFSVEADGQYESLMHRRLSSYRGIGEYFAYPYEEAVALLQSLIAENFAEKARLKRERQRLKREKEQQEAAQAKKQGMGISYRPLFKLLIDKSMKKTDLLKQVPISPSTLAKLSKGQTVDGSIIARLCEHLNCQPGDIMEYVPDTPAK
jgi:DNA-binding Xre family transcriptional regulator